MSFVNAYQEFHTLVSVYIPTCNRCDLLKRAINSVLNQTYKNIEIIVCDDGSSDNTEEYMLSLCKVYKNIIYLKNDNSKGACYSRNKAIEISTGEYITGLDDDDYFEVDRIAHFVSAWHDFSKKNNIAGLFDSVKVLTNNGLVVRNEAQFVTYKDLRKSNILGNQIFAPKKFYIESGLFDPIMPAWQDWEFWLRISYKFGYFVNINKSSYIADESHEFSRITIKNEHKIRDAKNKFINKISNVSLKERVYITSSLLAYPQVMPKKRELLLLLCAGKIKSFVKLSSRCFSYKDKV